MILALSLQRFLPTSATATFIALLGSLSLEAQPSNLNPSPADYAAAAAATNVTRHALPASPEAGQVTTDMALSTAPSDSAASTAPAAPDSGGPRFPGDLQYHGGPVAVSMESHAIYLHPNGSCTIAGCWGNPEGFLRDLGKSDMIHSLLPAS